MSDQKAKELPFSVLHGWVRSGLDRLLAVVEMAEPETVAEVLGDRSIAAVLSAIHAEDGNGPDAAQIAEALMACDEEKTRRAWIGRGILRIANIIEEWSRKESSPHELGKELRPALDGHSLEDVITAIQYGNLSSLISSLCDSSGGRWNLNQAVDVAEFIAADPLRAGEIVDRLRAAAPPAVIPPLRMRDARRIAEAIDGLEPELRGEVSTELKSLAERCESELDWNRIGKRISRIRRNNEDAVQSVFQSFFSQLQRGGCDAVFLNKAAIEQYVLRIARNKQARQDRENRQRAERGEPREVQNPQVSLQSGTKSFEFADPATGPASAFYAVAPLHVIQRVAWSLRSWSFDEQRESKRMSARRIVYALIEQERITKSGKQAIADAEKCSNRNIDRIWYRFVSAFLSHQRDRERLLYEALVPARHRQVVEQIVAEQWDLSAGHLAKAAGLSADAVTQARSDVTERLHELLHLADAETPWHPGKEDTAGDSEGPNA